MAASGNFVNDLLEKLSSTPWKTKTHVFISQLVTLAIGTIAIVLALHFTTVLDGILHAYAFMVSGLTVPTLGAFFWKKSSASGALAAMLAGGGLTLVLLIGGIEPPRGLAPSFYGILLSALVFIPTSLFLPGKSS
jgi:SSS family solute:Na+ symporter